MTAIGTIETFTPDGDGDEERGIRAAEEYANTQTTEGQRRPSKDEQTETVTGGKVLYQDLEYLGTGKEKYTRPPTNFMGGMAVEGLGYAARRQRALRRQVGRVAVLPGGNATGLRPRV